MKKYIKPTATIFELGACGMLAVSNPNPSVHPDSEDKIENEGEFLSNEQEAPFGSFEWQE